MFVRDIINSLGPLAVTAVATGAATLVGPIIPAAEAEPCPDTELVFARGTGEPPGLGPTGQAFLNALTTRIGTGPAVYAVDYPASDQWDTGVDGIRDAGAHVVSRATTCPSTKMVLGGYSQGAAVMGFVTSAQVPDGVDPATVPKPLDPEVADHVAAVVLFAMPNERAMNFLNEPTIVIGPLYQTKTLPVCAAEDAVCSDGMNFAAHDSYADEDPTMVQQGADFAARQLQGRVG
ncbi:cutinase family protein [Mycolicibacter minnesotensis]|uniref:Cutinase family protein n=1 Tax=Mycolicibacter minnesotensis TaxID=1118379 RepID=A0A7I7R2S2_9MYCO|nr:cutinase family protein [Mycolicibacter minnesotensis]ORB02606.1 cutinase family protein [Mycolicibacter minnesotensis]BBY32732.1 cutinase [Mycolicibacter minnesotensis]